MGLYLLIAILFRCHSQKAKSFVSCPFSDLGSHYFAVMHRQSIPGEIQARPMPCNEFSLCSHQHSSHPELFPVLTLLIVTGQAGSQKGVELVR